MRIFSAEYFASLAAVAIACAVTVVAARLRPGTWTMIFAKFFAVILVVNQVSWYVVERDSLSLTWSLPLGLCQVATFVSAAALWWHRSLLVELTYFWGLGGTTQALLTPALPNHFPSYFYFQYYLNHGGIILAALYLVAGLGLVPQRGAAVRVAVITLGYLVLVAGVNVLTGGNYLYLRHPLPTFSLLNLLGPWPWYIAGMIGLGIVVLFLLDLLLWPARRRRPRSGRPRLSVG
ncbi:MAG: TIGR02206 family membrane protein [Candidatus Dormibacteraeota bacterium]|nr:TIGR02206 family membrane protein [Candidatus Dormibacteraeota bacterium]